MPKTTEHNQGISKNEIADEKTRIKNTVLATSLFCQLNRNAKESIFESVKDLTMHTLTKQSVVQKPSTN